MTRDCEISHAATRAAAPLQIFASFLSKGLQPRSEDGSHNLDSPTTRLAFVPLFQNIFTDVEVSSVSNTSGFGIQTLENLARFSLLKLKDAFHNLVYSSLEGTHRL